MSRIPLRYLLGDPHPADYDPAPKPFFDYFEPCEEELYCRIRGRITSDTWPDWWEGIALNFRRFDAGQADYDPADDSVLARR